MVNNPSQLKSVEKLLYGVLKHLVKIGLTGNSTPTVMESLSKQAHRIEQLSREEQIKKKAMKRSLAEAAPSIKSLDLKRQRTNDQLPHVFGGSAPKIDIDVTKLPLETVIEGLIESLKNVSEQDLEIAIRKSRERIKTEEMISAPPAQGQPPHSQSLGEAGPSRQLQEAMEVDVKPIDPLKVEIDDDELDDDVDGINRNLNDTVAPSGEAQQVIQNQSSAVNTGTKSKAQSLLSAMQRIHNPTSLDNNDRLLVIRNAIARICKSIPQKVLTDSAEEEIRKSTIKFYGRDLWSVVLVRLLTRGLSSIGKETEDAQLELEKRARDTLIDFISLDFDRRFSIAILWLNEEWYNYTLRKKDDNEANLDSYNELLTILIEKQIYQLSNNSSSISSAAFVKFILDLPVISQDSLNKIKEICLDSESLKAPIGFVILRELVSMRLPVRQQSLEILLMLAVHPELKTRRAAVNSVRKWVPENEQLSPKVIEFALKSLHSLYEDQNDLLSSLIVKKEDDEIEVKKEKEDDQVMKKERSDSSQPMEEDGKEATAPHVELTAEERAKAIDTRVLERSELAFSLCLRSTDILRDVFAVYTKLSLDLKEPFERALTPLIRGLGSSNKSLLSILKTFNQESEPLALRILNVLTDFGKEKPSPELVTFIRELGAERGGEVDPRFVIPILQELTKVGNGIIVVLF